MRGTRGYGHETAARKESPFKEHLASFDHIAACEAGTPAKRAVRRLRFRQSACLDAEGSFPAKLKFPSTRRFHQCRRPSLGHGCEYDVLDRRTAKKVVTIEGDPPRLSWETEPVAMSADDALARENDSGDKPGPDAEAAQAAADWLAAALADGPRLVNDLVDEWKNGEGGSKRTLERAKQSLGVEAFRAEVPGPWWWRLPKAAKDESLGDLGNLGATKLFEGGPNVATFFAHDGPRNRTRSFAERALSDHGCKGGERVRAEGGRGPRRQYTPPSAARTGGPGALRRAPPVRADRRRPPRPGVGTASQNSKHPQNSWEKCPIPKIQTLHL